MHGGARRQLVAGHARGSAERPIQRGGGRHTCNSGGGERPKGAVALETVCPALFSYTGEVLISSLSLCLPSALGRAPPRSVACRMVMHDLRRWSAKARQHYHVGESRRQDDTK